MALLLVNDTDSYATDAAQDDKKLGDLYRILPIAVIPAFAGMTGFFLRYEGFLAGWVRFDIIPG